MVQAVRDSWVWNVTVYDTDSKTYTDPVSGKDYALSHLSGIDNHSMKFETKIEREKVKELERSNRREHERRIEHSKSRGRSR